MAAGSSRLVIAPPRCVFCAKPIAVQQDGYAGILLSFPGQPSPYQVEGHLECLKRAAHPDMAERLNESVRERERREAEARMNARIDALPWWRRRRLRRLARFP